MNKANQNLQQMISKMTGLSDPSNLLFQIFQTQNPNLSQTLKALQGMSESEVKNKVQEMAQKGDFTEAQLKNFEGIARRLGFNEKNIEELESSISFQRKRNRW